VVFLACVHLALFLALSLSASELPTSIPVYWYFNTDVVQEFKHGPALDMASYFSGQRLSVAQLGWL